MGADEHSDDADTVGGRHQIEQPDQIADERLHESDGITTHLDHPHLQRPLSRRLPTPERFVEGEIAEEDEKTRSWDHDGGRGVTEGANRGEKHHSGPDHADDAGDGNHVHKLGEKARADAGNVVRNLDCFRGCEPKVFHHSASDLEYVAGGHGAARAMDRKPARTLGAT